MSSDSRDPNEPGTTPDAQQGTLRVEVPHWAAGVRVYDNMYTPVSGLQPAREDPVGGETYTVEAALPPGVYQVEVVLEGESQREWVSVRPARVALVPRKKWKGLEFTSAAPLRDTATADPGHIRPAVKWSRRLTTSPDAEPGRTSLFLFVRSRKPAPPPTFAEGLSLLDGKGNLVTDFGSGVRKGRTGGWMAYHDNLPPGPYVLRRARSGVRLRHQPLYLCAGWQTQVFLPADTKPSLQYMSVNMARPSAGFRPDDEAAVAAEAVLDALRYGQDIAQLVKSEKVLRLLEGEFENPWLGILAAYALLQHAEETARAGQTDREADALLKHVLSFLRSRVKDHPDVRALLLDAGQPAPEPFWHPPLFRAGLRMVQRHATEFVSTITPRSLTDCVLEATVFNSPWTAWRHLPRLPQGWEGTEAAASFTSRKKGAAGPVAPAPVVSFLHSASPKAPIFQLRPTESSAGLEAAGGEPPPPCPTFTVNIASAEDASLITAAQELTRTGRLKDMPETKVLEEHDLDKLLEKVELKEFSAESGLPLSRAVGGLARLRQSGRTDFEAVGPPPTLTPAEQSILQYVVYKSGAVAPADPGLPSAPAGLESAVAEAKSASAGLESAAADAPAADAPAADAPAADAPAADAPAADDAGASPADATASAEPSAKTPAISIEECVSKLREEARRLLLATRAAEGEPEQGHEAAARNVARRAQEVADHLLRCATFSAITTSDGRLRYGNGAFVMLLTSGAEGPQAGEASMQAQREWEAALAVAPVGSSLLTQPAAKGVTAGWRLRRTALESGGGQSVRGYLNAFRAVGVPFLPLETFTQLDSLLSELSLYASFFAHGSAERRSEYVDELESVTTEIERVTRAGGQT